MKRVDSDILVQKYYNALKGEAEGFYDVPEISRFFFIPVLFHHGYSIQVMPDTLKKSHGIETEEHMSDALKRHGKTGTYWKLY